MKIEYVAYDGIKFDNETDCKNYENDRGKFFKERKRLVFWSTPSGALTTTNLGQVPMFLINDEEKMAYQQASAMFIRDKEVLGYVKSFCKQAENFKDYNCFYFWNGIDKWVSEKEIKAQCVNSLNQIALLKANWSSDLTQSDNKYTGVNSTLKDESMIDEDGNVYPF